MFNLLHMDLYRARKSKSVYVCLGIQLLAIVISFGVLWLMTTPQGHAYSVRIGMLTVEDTKEMTDTLDGVDILLMFRQICMSGGMHNVVFGIWVMLFVCMDFQGGFIKNVMALHQNRWNYIGSKLMTAGIVNFCYLSLQFLFTVLVNRLFGNMVSGAGWGDIGFYLTWAWLLTTAFSALLILICIQTRSTAAGAVAAVLLGGGAVVSLLYEVLGIFHMEEWLNHTIYLTLAMGPGQYRSVRDLSVYATGAGFLVLYTGAAGLILKRQDI